MVQWSRIKTNITSMVYAVGILGTIVGAILAVESRYAKAGDYDAVQREQVLLRGLVERQTVQQQLFYLDFLQQQQLSLERDIVLLRSKRNRTPDDDVVLDSYTQRLAEIRIKVEQARTAVGAAYR